MEKFTAKSFFKKKNPLEEELKEVGKEEAKETMNEQPVNEPEKEELAEKQEVAVVDNSTLPQEVSPETLFNRTIQQRLAEGDSISDLSTELVHAKVTTDLISDKEENRGFQKIIRGKKAQEIEETFEQKVQEKKAKTMESKNQKAKQFYEGFKQFFMFFKLTEPAAIPFMIFLIFVGIVPFTTVKIVEGIIEAIRAVIVGLNELALDVAKFTKPVRIVITTLFFIVAIALIILALIMGIEALFGIKILEPLQQLLK